MSYELLWLRAFALTVLIEVPLWAWLLRPRFERLYEALFVALILQVITHPALWFVAPRFEPYWAWVVVMELCVLTVEAGVAAAVMGRGPGWGATIRLAFLASLVANGVSTVVGLLIH